MDKNPRSHQALTAQRIADAIQESGLSLTELADRTGIPYTTLHRRATGRTSVYVEELRIIADALGIPVTDLVVVEEDAA